MTQIFLPASYRPAAPPPPPVSLDAAVPDRDLDPRALVQRRTRQLAQKLKDRADGILKHRLYYRGEQELRFASDNWSEAFGDTFGQVRDNWMRLVVDAASERMEVQGIRLEATDPEGDKDAWKIWQSNQLDLHSTLLHTDTIVCGYGYTLTWRDANGDARITIEDPLETIVMRDPADRRRIVAGLKRWRDLGDGGEWHALYFTPETVWTLSGGTRADPADVWEILTEVPNPMGVVPLVEFVNDPDIQWCGHSDLEPVEPLQDLADKMLADMGVASEFTAYRQRVLIGAEIPVDPETDKPIKQAEFGLQRLLALEEGASIQELEASDLSNYTGVLEAIVTHIAALTRTPPQYLLGSMVNVSGDALQAAESGLFSRVRRKLQIFGESWEETLRLAFVAMGLDGFAPEASTVWKDPEITSEATRVDALVKLKSLGVPDEALWELYGKDDAGRERWRTMADQQAQRQGFELGLGAGDVGLEQPTPELAA